MHIAPGGLRPLPAVVVTLLAGLAPPIEHLGASCRRPLLPADPTTTLTANLGRLMCHQRGCFHIILKEYMCSEVS
ncbi:hypothetical protein BD414DRAFT_500786 [Trametes punicea]|nr:hypothetical protein BD414DRAFT_500786 [Trametes punicea]